VARGRKTTVHQQRDAANEGGGQSKQKGEFLYLCFRGRGGRDNDHVLDDQEEETGRSSKIIVLGVGTTEEWARGEATTQGLVLREISAMMEGYG